MLAAELDPSSWTPAVPLTHWIPGLARPDVAAGRGGCVHVLYEADKTIWHLMQDQGQWTTPARVTAGRQPAAIAVGEVLHVVFANEFAGNVEICHAQWRDGVWSLPRTLSFTSGASVFPRIAAGPDGSLHIVWTDDTPGYSVIYYGRQVGTFWVNRPVSNGRGESPALAIDSQGLVHVAWQDRQPSSGPWQAYYLHGDGRTWSLPENISASKEHDATGVRTVVDHDDSAYVIWCEQAVDQSKVLLSFRSGDRWTAPETLAPSLVDLRAMDVALAAHGTLHLAYATSHRVYHRYRGPGSLLSPIELVAEERYDVLDLALCLDPNEGDVHLVWVVGQQQGNMLSYAHRGPALPYRRFLPLDEAHLSS
jgi:hypothetical protein